MGNECAALAAALGAWDSSLATTSIHIGHTLLWTLLTLSEGAPTSTESSVVFVTVGVITYLRRCCD